MSQGEECKHSNIWSSGVYPYELNECSSRLFTRGNFYDCNFDYFRMNFAKLNILRSSLTIYFFLSSLEEYTYNCASTTHPPLM